MPRRPNKRASGPTQPESRRAAKPVLLRLLPADRRLLDELAEDAGAPTRSAYVARLIRTAAGVDPGPTWQRPTKATPDR